MNTALPVRPKIKSALPSSRINCINSGLEKYPSPRSRIWVREAINHANATINRAQYSGTQIGRAFASREIGTHCVAGNGRESKLFWGRISSRASTSRRFLRIDFWIIPIISNGCYVIRPIYEIFRLANHITTDKHGSRPLTQPMRLPTLQPWRRHPHPSRVAPRQRRLAGCVRRRRCPPCRAGYAHCGVS